jgi:hypothetical protein
MSKPDTIVPVTIRFPANLHKMLTEAASGNSPRTPFNTEVVRRLYDSFKMPNNGWEDTMQEQSAEIRRLAERVAQLESEKK